MMTNGSDSYVVDTHALIWRFRDDPRLPDRMHTVFDAAERNEVRLLVPTVVMAELLHLFEGRMPEIPLNEILESIAAMEAVTVVPFDLAVFDDMRALPRQIQIHDRVIAATSRIYGAPVMTTDGVLTSTVQTVWT